MNWLLALLFSFTVSAHAADTVVNEVLFELNQEVWTSYDFKQFLRAKSKVPMTAAYLKQPKDEFELFVLTRIVFYQISSSASESDSGSLSLLKKYREQNDSFNAEVQRLKLVAENDEARFQQLTTKDKYDLWIGYMKKKYNYIPQ